MTLETHEIRAFGVPLREAIAKFASQDLLDEFEEALQPITHPEFDQQKPWMSVVKGISFLAQIPQLEKAKFEQQARVQNELQEHLKFWLETGELVGCGNQVSPVSTRTPRKIQTDFWRNAEINWESEIAKDAVRVYQRILIIDPDDFPGRAIFPGMGPKYFATEIREAMRELEIEISKFKTSETPHKVRANLVRERVKRNHPKINTNGRGFDVDTIRRHFKRHCISNPA